MKKYKVYGTYTITITKEVWATNEDDAIDKASNTFGGIIEYCGNGGYDKLVGVENDDESVAADGIAEWGNDIEVIENNPDYYECPECQEELKKTKDGVWYCKECNMWFDEDGDEIDSSDYEDN